jgi:biopolymer transport protein ExbD
MRNGKTIAEIQAAKRRTRRRFSFTLNMTPMMDVMFNLLVFFIVTASFTTPEGLLEAKLPRSTGIAAQAMAVPVVPIKIFLEPSGSEDSPLIRVSTSLHPDAASLRLVQSFDQLYSLLNEMQSRPGINEKTPVIIAAKPAVTWNQVVSAYNASIRARYKNVVFAGY